MRRAEALLRRARREQAAAQLLSGADLTFGPQSRFVDDRSQLVAACCSRRSGKSWGLMVKALRACERFPGCTVFYVTNTRRQAERGFWNQVLLPFLGGDATTGRPPIPHHLNKNELTCTFPNGSRILLGGANDSAEIETYRGSKTPLAILDEAQSFRPLIKTLAEDVFLPQTADFGSAGQIVMTGTPNPFAAGYFHDAVTGSGEEKGWSVHGWTFFDNPHMPDPRAWLERYCAKKGLTLESPRIQREYFGRWVRDTQGLVYPFPSHSILDRSPDLEDGDWRYVLGLDLGYVDATAFVTVAYEPSLARIVVLDSHQKTEMIPDAVAAHVEGLLEEYDYESIVADAQGLGKPYVETMIQKYGLPVEAAKKSDKLTAIEHCRGDIQAGVLQVVRWTNQELLHDASLFCYNFDKIDKAKAGGLRLRADVALDDRTPDHLLDAMLYAHRKCAAYLNTGVRGGPTPGSREWNEAREEALWEAVREGDEPRAPWDPRDELLPDGALF